VLSVLAEKDIRKCGKVAFSGSGNASYNIYNYTKVSRALNNILDIL